MAHVTKLLYVIKRINQQNTRDREDQEEKPREGDRKDNKIWPATERKATVAEYLVNTKNNRVWDLPGLIDSSPVGF